MKEKEGKKCKRKKKKEKMKRIGEKKGCEKKEGDKN